MFDIDSYYSFVYTVLVRYIQITKIIYQIMRVFRKMVSFMEIILTNTSTKPIYEQITSQIKEMILKGELKPGDSMPSMRKLAKDLHVSVITTQRAYDDLVKDGFIITIPAKGTFVSAENQDFIREENLRKIENLLTTTCELAKQNGLTLEELQRTLILIYTEES